MIFRLELARLIAQGKKTQTRRRVKSGESKCRYVEGRAYTIQTGRGKPGNGQITITAVRQERASDITLHDAKREGFRTTSEFLEYWDQLHGEGFRDALVWVISFERGDTRDTPRLLRASAPQAPVCKAQVRYADGKMRACNRAFQDEQDVCKCGARRPPESDEDHGYTTRRVNALKGEGEPVSERMLERYAEAGRERHVDVLAEQRRRALSVIAELRLEAIRRGASPKANKRYKSAEHHLRALDQEARRSA